jgi:hypothetical protein
MFSLYVPSATRIVSPSTEESIAAWMVDWSEGTWMVAAVTGRVVRNKTGNRREEKVIVAKLLKFRSVFLSPMKTTTI